MIPLRNNRGPGRRRPDRGAESGMAPSCLITLRPSIKIRLSAILPATARSTTMPFTVICLPVAGTPKEFAAMSATPSKAAKHMVPFRHHLLYHPMDVGKGGAKRADHLFKTLAPLLPAKGEDRVPRN